MADATTRLGLPYPEDTDTPDVPRDIQALAQALDPIVATTGQGLLVDRPVTAPIGDRYYATDVRGGTEYLMTGTGWEIVQRLTLVPPGVVTPYAGAVAPLGWLLCNGQAVSRTTYADLFGSIGTAFGAGNGTTTFNVPDLRGRMPLGLDNLGGGSANRVTDAAADTMGGAGGTETHTLTAAQQADMPVVDDGTGGNPRVAARLTAVTDNTTGPAGQPAGYVLASWPPHGESVVTNASRADGGGQAHPNMPPYLALSAIIKV
jgi:microcystin-dependent protein